MSIWSAGAGVEQARNAYARAFNRFGLGRPADIDDVLADAQTAIGHLGASFERANSPGASFIAAQIADTGALLGTLRDSPDATRSDVATGLLALDFLLRAIQAQQDAASKPRHCMSCHSTHLVARGTPELPLYECTDCGFTAAYSAA